ncbi:MAG: imidazole glycerol phosphate synthase subunit HisH [Alphaproteobacteria bacterium]|nr:imidazole glycerol phosphate synthase subunit HisH [Alphaproteobacteria bacterium]
MITIVDYGVCNVGSLRNMLKKIGSPSQVSGDPEVIAEAGKLILPGVGSFDPAIQRLQKAGLDAAIKQAALQRNVPVLGICLGMQLMGHASEEGNLAGLGLIDAESRRFVRSPEYPDLRIPHMGWNSVALTRNHPLFLGLEAGNRFYFVHSYHVVCVDSSDVLGETGYGGKFTSCFAHGNLYGTQFHPEKSNRFGMKILQNFAGI